MLDVRAPDCVRLALAQRASATATDGALAFHSHASARSASVEVDSAGVVTASATALLVEGTAGARSPAAWDPDTCP